MLGPYVDLAERTALCNSPTELGAYGVFFPPSQRILEFAAERARRAFTPVYADADAAYEKEAALALDAIEPQPSAAPYPDWNARITAEDRSSFPMSS